MVSAKFVIASIAAAYAAAVAAAPVEDTSGSILVARAEVSVLMCEDKDFRGRCENEVAQTGRCCMIPVPHLRPLDLGLVKRSLLTRDIRQRPGRDDRPH